MKSTFSSLRSSMGSCGSFLMMFSGASAQELPTQVITTPAIEQQKAKIRPDEKPSIIGDISDGRLSPKPLPKVLPEFKIHWTSVHQKKDHKVVFNRVEEPPQSARVSKQQKRSAQSPQSPEPPGEGRPHYYFTVSATVYDQLGTKLKLWSHDEPGKVLEVASNVDWQHLEGFQSFTGRGQRFTFILFSQNQNPSNQEVKKRGRTKEQAIFPAELPRYRRGGARYMLLEGDEKNEKAMEFLESIHDLYDEKRPQLIKASREREKNVRINRKLEEELRKNPPPKPDITINYWKKKTPPTRKGGK